MEEDIKILEELKEVQERCIENTKDSPFTMLWKRQNQAIENLLKRYKELEEAVDNFMKGKAHSTKQLEDINKNYIPISAIQNKINELEKEQDEEHNAGDFTKIFEHEQDLQLCIDVLQELLEERNK